MIRQFEQISVTRRIAIAALMLGIIGTSVFSWAAVQDTLTHTNTYSLLSVDLKASTDGTTYAESTAISWALDPAPMAVAVKPLQMKNSGNANATVGVQVSGPALPPGNFGSGAFKIFEVANQAACIPSISGLGIGSFDMNLGNANLTTPFVAGSTRWLCMQYTGPNAELTPSDLNYVQTLTFTSTSI